MELERWPRFKALYLRAFRNLWAKKSGTIDRNGNPWFGNRYFKTPEELFNWWLEDSGRSGKKVDEGKSFF